MRLRSVLALVMLLSGTAVPLVRPLAPLALAQTPPGTASPAVRLDTLFKELRQAGGEDLAELIVAQIWDAWRDATPAEVRPLADQAGAEMARGEFHAAVALLDEVVKRAPLWPEGWNMRATALYLLGDHARSLADCHRVLALEPRHFGALAGMGLIHMAAGRFAAALEAYKRALGINPYLKERIVIIPALEKQVQGKPL